MNSIAQGRSNCPIGVMVISPSSAATFALSPLSALAQLARTSAGREIARANDCEILEVVFMPQGPPGQNPSARPIIIGVDEAGRGPLAGPVVAAAVVLGDEVAAGLDDSKKLSAKRRATFDEQIRKTCHWAVAVVHPDEIDRINIFQATMVAMTRSVRDLADKLAGSPDEVLIDGNQTPERRCADWIWPARAIVGGDGIEPAISAASIVAKEWRDRLMVEAAHAHPHYGWERNKGYGTAEHMEALRLHGPSPLHRRSFAPVAQASLL